MKLAYVAVGAFISKLCGPRSTAGGRWPRDLLGDSSPIWGLILTDGA